MGRRCAGDGAFRDTVGLRQHRPQLPRPGRLRWRPSRPRRDACSPRLDGRAHGPRRRRAIPGPESILAGPPSEGAATPPLVGPAVRCLRLWRLAVRMFLRPAQGLQALRRVQHGRRLPPRGRLVRRRRRHDRGPRAAAAVRSAPRVGDPLLLAGPGADALQILVRGRHRAVWVPPAARGARVPGRHVRRRHLRRLLPALRHAARVDLLALVGARRRAPRPRTAARAAARARAREAAAEGALADRRPCRHCARARRGVRAGGRRRGGRGGARGCGCGCRGGRDRPFRRRRRGGHLSGRRGACQRRGEAGLRRGGRGGGAGCHRVLVGHLCGDARAASARPLRH
mmetsp:Transcript_16160/g.52969  ORF Transcript_16160/g.52969 Transcript_16160/m.52969 type:complete len:342 (-) Transcript_16160:1247-2272(-)